MDRHDGTLEQLEQLQRVLESATNGLQNSMGALKDALAEHEALVRGVVHARRQPERLSAAISQSFSGATDGLRTLSHTLTDISHATQPLVESMAVVTDLGDQIEQIAYTTQLTALNAAAAAERAGEQGATFAVVAQETAALPDITTNLSSEMRQLILHAGEVLQQATQSLSEGAHLVETVEQSAERRLTDMQALTKSRQQTISTLLAGTEENGQQAAGALDDSLRLLRRFGSAECEIQQVLDEADASLQAKR